MNLPRLFLLTLTPFFVCPEMHGQTAPEAVKFRPTEPVGGQEIAIEYNAAYSDLLPGSEVRCITYVNADEEIPTATEIVLQRQDDVWRGAISTPTNAKSVLVVFQDTLGNLDNNQGKGYWLPVYQDGKKVAGALASIGEMYASGWDPTYTYHLSRQPELAKALYEQEFHDNPDLKRKFTRYYLGTFNTADPAQLDQLKAELDRYAQLADLSEWELLMAVSKYYADIHETALAEKYKQEVFNRFPQGSWSIQTRSLPLLKAVYLSNSLEERRSIYERFKTEYKEFPDEFTRRTMTVRGTQMLGKVLELYEGKGIPDFWLSEIEGLEPEYQKYAYNTAARMVSTGSTNYKLAEALSRKALDMQTGLMNAPRVPIERLFKTDREIAYWREQALAEYHGRLGKILMKQNRTDEALPVLKDAAIIWGKRKQSELNGAYIDALIQSRDNREALREMDGMIKMGTVTKDINDAYQKLSKNPQNLISLRQEAADGLKARLAKTLLHEKVTADISFKDRLGNTVYLSDYEGKTIVIDCWASWCGPCIAGLPGMERLVDQYKTRSDVVFLFLNTQDSKARERALEIFKGKPIDQHLVFDSSNEAAKALHVSGLPTKLVVDKTQTIRFRHAGTQGSMQEQMDELNAMIELAQ